MSTKKKSVISSKSEDDFWDYGYVKNEPEDKQNSVAGEIMTPHKNNLDFSLDQKATSAEPRLVVEPKEMITGEKENAKLCQAQIVSENLFQNDENEKLLQEVDDETLFQEELRAMEESMRPKDDTSESGIYTPKPRDQTQATEGRKNTTEIKEQTLDTGERTLAARSQECIKAMGEKKPTPERLQSTRERMRTPEKVETIQGMGENIHTTGREEQLQSIREKIHKLEKEEKLQGMGESVHIPEKEEQCQPIGKRLTDSNASLARRNRKQGRHGRQTKEKTINNVKTEDEIFISGRQGKLQTARSIKSHRAGGRKLYTSVDREIQAAIEQIENDMDTLDRPHTPEIQQDKSAKEEAQDTTPIEDFDVCSSDSDITVITLNTEIRPRFDSEVNSIRSFPSTADYDSFRSKSGSPRSISGSRLSYSGSTMSVISHGEEVEVNVPDKMNKNRSFRGQIDPNLPRTPWITFRENKPSFFGRIRQQMSRVGRYLRKKARVLSCHKGMCK